MHPLVSVIIPTYNYAHFITDAVNSVLHQDYPSEKIEIIVVDDGSTDSTKDVLSEFTRNNTVKYFYQENKGKASATNKAIQNANGNYIFNLDADDYFLPGKIKKTVEIFESDESIVHVGTPAKQIMPDNSFKIEPVPADMIEKTLNGNVLLERFMNENMLFGGGSTYAARASVLKLIEIPEAVDMFIDEFLVLAILPFGNSFFIHEYLSIWRGHGFNYSGVGSNKEIQIAKNRRLLMSSDAVLIYLQKNNYDKSLVNIYRLKNLTSKLSYKELLHKKTAKDITSYAVEVFFHIKPNRRLIKKYHVMNRLIPTSLFNFLKNTFSGRNTNSLITG